MIVVSGYRRTGTSMMMQALCVGLLQRAVLAFHDRDEKKGNVEVDGYIPNPGPLFEVGGHYRDAEFLRGLPKDALVKIFFDGLPALPAGDWTVIFMDRDDSEIVASCERVAAHFEALGDYIPQKSNPDLPFDVYRDFNRDDIEHVVGIMEQRRDVRLVRVSYNELVKDPIGTFSKLAFKSGLMLDIEKAASVVDAKYYRARNDVNSESRGLQRAANG